MYVKNVTTPTLIMTGELDRRTPMPQSEEYFVGPQDTRHVPTTLLRFDSEYHGTGGQKPALNFIRTQLYMLSWYKRYSAPIRHRIRVNILPRHPECGRRCFGFDFLLTTHYSLS